MSQNFVTPDELDKRLDLYEKLGSSELACAKMDEAIKKYVRQSLENSHMQITTLVEQRADQLYQKIDSHIKKYIENQSVHIQEHSLSTIGSFVDKAKRDLESDLNLAVKAKMQDAFVAVTNSQKSFEAATEKVFWSKLNEFETKMREEINAFEKTWIERASIMGEEAISKVKDGVQNSARVSLSEYVLKIEKIVEELRSELSIEMSKKLVDKQAIEQKMRDIEHELNKKAQGIIDFNIEQARQNMEQAARAEVEEGIKTAAGKIMSGLT